MPNTTDRSGRKKRFLRWARVSYMLLLFSSTVLVLALLAFLAFSKSGNEAQYVNSDGYQAVFLDSGNTVYFGKITSVNGQYLRLADVFYVKQPEALSTNGTNINLSKLGCEAYGPKDEAILNRDNVSLWENLSEKSAVVTKIAQYNQANPNGLKC